MFKSLSEKYKMRKETILRVLLCPDWLCCTRQPRVINCKPYIGLITSMGLAVSINARHVDYCHGDYHSHRPPETRIGLYYANREVLPMTKWKRKSRENRGKSLPRGFCGGRSRAV